MSVTGIVGLVIAYVVGSFPSAYLAGRMLKGIDLRTVGSGNLGATNVYREIGAGPAVVVLMFDALKGALPALFLPGLLGVGFNSQAGAAWWAFAFGAAAIVGHVRPVFLLGKGGGKGVATAAGVFLALTPIPALAALAGFAGTVAYTRWVSLASIVGAVLLPVFEWVASGASPAFYASLAVGVFVIVRHRSNIVRLRAGNERQLGHPAGGDA